MLSSWRGNSWRVTHCNPAGNPAGDCLADKTPPLSDLAIDASTTNTARCQELPHDAARRARPRPRSPALPPRTRAFSPSLSRSRTRAPSPAMVCSAMLAITKHCRSGKHVSRRRHTHTDGQPHPGLQIFVRARHPAHNPHTQACRSSCVSGEHVIPAADRQRERRTTTRLA